MKEQLFCASKVFALVLQALCCCFQGKIHYYMREKYYGHAQTEALEGLKKYGNDPLLKFYIGANKILEGEGQLYVTNELTV